MSESLPYSGVEIVDVMRNAVVAQACRSKPLQVVGDRPGRGGHDGLVQRGQEHAHHQAAQDGQDLAVATATGAFRGAPPVVLVMKSPVSAGVGQRPVGVAARPR